MVKDEIKKGSFSISFGTSGTATSGLAQFDHRVVISDTGAETNYKVNSPAGEYGILVASEEAGDSIHASATGTKLNVGLIYYQAGIVVLDGTKIFTGYDGVSGDPDLSPPGEMGDDDGILTTMPVLKSAGVASGDARGYQPHFLTGSINTMADFVRAKLYNINFSNTTELNSTIYFCRANHNEFNYSSNQTYLTGSKVRVKGDEPDELPKTYVTTVGLYAADNELLAVAKLSEPLRKDPTNELTLRVRLDY